MTRLRWIPLSTALVAAAAAGPAALGSSTRTVSIFVPRGTGGDCSRVVSLPRVVRADAPLTGAVRALLAGPTAPERARGYGGWFSTATAGRVRSVRIEHGVAFVDFENFARRIPNAASSCGSELLLAQLDRTARQFPSVRRTVYSFDGSSRTFYTWLQRVPPPGA